MRYGDIASGSGNTKSMTDTIELYRPTGPAELQLVAESGYRAWPPRLDWQPIFYPVLNEEYATQIAFES